MSYVEWWVFVFSVRNLFSSKNNQSWTSQHNSLSKDQLSFRHMLVEMILSSEILLLFGYLPKNLTVWNSCCSGNSTILIVSWSFTLACLVWSLDSVKMSSTNNKKIIACWSHEIDRFYRKILTRNIDIYPEKKVVEHRRRTYTVF